MRREFRLQRTQERRCVLQMLNARCPHLRDGRCRLECEGRGNRKGDSGLLKRRGTIRGECTGVDEVFRGITDLAYGWKLAVKPRVDPADRAR